MNSLQTLCFKNLEKTKCIELYKNLPKTVYNDFVKFLMNNNFSNWKQNISLVNLEVNIKEIEVDQDMYFDEFTYHIFVKKKINYEDEEDYEDEDENENEDEFILFHEYLGDYKEYNNYFEIAKLRGLIDNTYEDYDNYYLLNEEY